MMQEYPQKYRKRCQKINRKKKNIYILADKGYDSNKIREIIKSRKYKPIIAKRKYKKRSLKRKHMKRYK